MVLQDQLVVLHMQLRHLARLAFAAVVVRSDVFLDKDVVENQDIAFVEDLGEA